jgi:hypothetical protein
MFTSESEKNKTKKKASTRPPIIPLEFIPIHILENQGIRFEVNVKKWIQSILLVQSYFLNTLIRPLVNSPNSQNEIVGRFPGRVHSHVVRLFPVWTPSQSPTCAINLCGVNGLVSVHRPNLRKTKVQHDTPTPTTNDNLPSSIRRMNKRLNIPSVRSMPYLLSNP